MMGKLDQLDKKTEEKGSGFVIRMAVCKIHFRKSYCDDFGIRHT